MSRQAVSRQAVSRQAVSRHGPLRALGMARILFGALVLCRTTPVFDGLVAHGAAGGPLGGASADPWHVTVYWLALPSGVIAGLSVARTIGVAFFTIGVRAREAGVAAAVIGWIVLAQDVAGYINTMHLLYSGLMVLALGGAGSSLALRPEREQDPESARALVRALVVSVYAWSGLAKLNSSWLSGDALAQFKEAGIVRGPLAQMLLSSPGRCAAVACGVVATELAIGPLLIWPRTRRAAIAGALVFHGALEWTVHPDVFGLAMGVLLLSFFEDGRAQSSGDGGGGGGGGGTVGLDPHAPP